MFMIGNCFYGVGKFISQFHWIVIIVWLGLLCVCIPFLPQVLKPYTEIGFTDKSSASAIAKEEMNRELGYTADSLIILFKAKNDQQIKSDDFSSIKKALDKLDQLKIEHKVTYPSPTNQLSKDKRLAYAVVFLKKENNIDNKELISNVKKLLVLPDRLSYQLGGMPVFLEDTKSQTESDLYRAEYIVIPIAIIIMLMVFGSVVAACVPIIVGGISSLIVLTILYFIAKNYSLSVFTVNIAIFLGLSLTLDYCLFIISRFRQELAREPNSISEAISYTLATAGKAIFFSGFAVLVSLSALLMFRVNILYSIGIGGMVAVTIASLSTLTLLPALLVLLNKKINALSLFSANVTERNNHIWLRLSTIVVKYAKSFFIIILAFLLFLSVPLLDLKTGNSDFQILPKALASRQTFDTFKNKFGESNLYPIYVVVNSKNDILAQRNIESLFDFTKLLEKNPNVKQVKSIVNFDSNMNKEYYVALYNHSKDLYPEAVKKSLELTTNKNMTVVSVISKFPSDTPQTKKLINEIKQMHINTPLTFKLTGNYVNSIEVFNSIKATFPYAAAWIIISTYIILLILLRSLLLPIKAILMNILSLMASYGVLVFVFQQGHLHKLLHFEPQGMLDISLLIIIFCVLFGMSMDYEVFLLTRINEYFERTKQNNESIIHGIVNSSKIITSAAIVVISISFAFMTASMIIVKAVGLGMAVAVFVDAFIIRTLFVPATMVLLGSWNWYLPKWLDKVLPKTTLDH